MINYLFQKLSPVSGYALLILCFISCANLDRDPEEEIPTPSSSAWVLNQSKSDDFNSWDSSRWGTDLWYKTSSDFAFNAANTYVTNGNLVIEARKEDFEGKKYSAGAARSKFKVGANTRVEIRAKLPDYRAHVTSALWIADAPTTEGSPNLEIDIMETYLNKGNVNERFTSGIHYWWRGNKPQWATGITSSSDQSLGWLNHSISTPLSDHYHIWTIERYDNKILFYFDNILFWTNDITKHDTKGTFDSFIPEEYRKNFNEQERDIIFSIEGHAGTPVPEYMPAQLLIDYVRVYDRKTN